MKTKPKIGDKVGIKGYSSLKFNVVGVAKEGITLQHPMTGATMSFALRELEG